MQSATPAPANSRFLWADFIRGMGIVLVILGHVSSIPMQRFHDVTPLNWQVANIYNVIARSCVPLLFMISGALLLPRQESLKDFFRKRFKRVLFPFLLWSLLYIFWKEGCFSIGGTYETWRQGCFGEYSFVNSIKVIIMWLITRPAEYHLWFMYELFAIYLITPVLRVIVNAGRDDILWYMIAIWFVFGPLQRLVEFRLRFDLIFDLGYLTGYLGYFILGYLITKIKITKPMLVAAGIVYVAMAYYTANITMVYSFREGKLVDYFQFLLSWNVVLLSSSLYILLRAWAETIFQKPHPFLAKVAVSLTAASFGIYLLHVFVISWMEKLHISPLVGSAIVAVPLTTLCVFFVSWLIIALLMKIPYVREVVA
jgi:surface polysaccharide O-acyltransferase-like enzyme